MKVVARVVSCVFVFVFVFGGGCITDRVLVEGDEGTVVADAAVVERAKQKTAQLRHLPFSREVPIDVMTVEQLEEWLNRYYDDYKVVLKRQDYFHHKMGILPASRDTASTWKGFLGGFAGGVYDDERVAPDGTKGTMILVQDYAWWSKVQLDLIGVITGVDMAYEVFLAHELTHALQDQHFHLDALLDDVSNADVRMVQKTLLESEANIMGMAHFTGMRLNTVAERKAFFVFLRYNNLFNAPLLTAAAGKTPSFFSKQTFAQYELGLDWVEGRLDDGEWKQRIDGVGEGAAAELALAYARVPGTNGAMPASTEQLLFADKRSDPPLLLPMLAVDENKRWAPLPHAARSNGDVFGALALKHWTEDQKFSFNDDVARGWGGDRYDVFVDDDDSPVLLWRFIGDSDEDAAEIAAAVFDRFGRSLGEGRFVVAGAGTDRVTATIAVAPDEKRFVRTTRAERLRVERRGARVVVVNGVSDDVDLDGLTDALFDATVATGTDLHTRTVTSQALIEQLEQSFTQLPKAPELGLVDRAVLPARTMSFRLGVARFSFREDTNEASSFVGGDVEARWGVRDWLELSLPGAFTLHQSAGPFTLAVGVAPGSVPIFDPLVGTWSGRIAATASWQTSTTLLQAQLEAQPRGSFADVAGFADPVQMRAGASLRPLPQLVVSPGFSFSPGDSDEEFGDAVEFGGVVERGFVDEPLVEVEVVPGLMAYWSGVWRCRVDGERFKGLTLVEQKHALGLLLYF